MFSAALNFAPGSQSGGVPPSRTSATTRGASGTSKSGIPSSLGGINFMNPLGDAKSAMEKRLGSLPSTAAAAGARLKINPMSTAAASTSSTTIASSSLATTQKSVTSSSSVPLTSSLTSSKLGPNTSTSSNAQSKRCRFATSTSTGQKESPPLGTLAPNDLYDSQTRRSRSPGPKGHFQRQGYGQYPDHLQGKTCDISDDILKRDGIKFNAPLMMEQAEELMLLATSGKPLPEGLQIRDMPPMRPQGGTMYLTRTSNPSQKDGSGLCSDGYNWVEILYQADLATPRGNSIDYRHYYIGMGQRTSSRFRREAYTLGGLTLVAYIGDEREATTEPSAAPQKHFNSLPRSHRYDKRSEKHKRGNIFSSSLALGRPASAASTARPRSLDRLEMERQISHQGTLRSIAASSESSAALMSTSLRRPPHQLSLFDELTSLSEELAGGKLVKNLTLFPSMQITLVHPDMTREFEQSCQVLYGDHPDPTYLGLDEGIMLFYDITFCLGKVYATLLTYINCCYEGNPVMPLAVNLHERKFKSSHQLFWARIVGDIPALQKYRFPLMIDDAEPAVHLAVRTQAPNLVQLEGWTHRFRDIDRHLRSKGYGEEAVSYYKACIGYLLSANSKQAMHDRYRKEFECVWPKDFVHYYRNKLLPRSGRLGKWAMAKMNIREPQYFSPHTNPQERFHMLCRNFSGWETLTVDQVVRGFHLLFLFFIAETRTSSSSSAFVLKSSFRHLFNMPHLSGNYPANTLHPADIREYVMNHYSKTIKSRPMVAYGSSTTSQFAASHDGGLKHHAGIEDVLQLGDALESMFYNETGEDNFDLRISELLHSGDTARFLSNGHLPSSTIGTPFGRYQQVPSPAPNGRVPSPAPGDGDHPYGEPKYQQGGGGGGGTGGGPGGPPLRSIHSSLSTIPEVPAENKTMINVIPPSLNTSSVDIPRQTTCAPPPIPAGGGGRPQAKRDVLNNYPPDLLVHSTTAGSMPPLPGNNWQDSFDSSIVTESHYDASFESEVPPMGVSMDGIQPETTTSATAVPTSQRHQPKHLFKRSNNQQKPQLNKVAMQNNAAKLAPVSCGGGVIGSAPSHSNKQQQQPVPNSLMLWKKVQHYVVVGGSFVSAASAAANETANAATSVTTSAPSTTVVSTTNLTKGKQPHTSSYHNQQQRVEQRQK